MSTLIKAYTAVIFQFIIVSHIHESSYRLAVLITNPVLFWTRRRTWRSNNSLITSYSWLTTQHVVCFGCVLGIHIRTTHPVWLLWSGVSRGIVEGDGRSETLPQVTESHIKAASLESDRREGNRIREDFNRPETVIQERVCAIVTYQLSQSVVLQVILNTIPIIQSALSIISTSLSQLRWTEIEVWWNLKKGVVMEISVLVHFIKWNSSIDSEHH